MKTLDLKTFFSKINYDWQKDKETINTIAHYTKTRVRKNRPENCLTAGTEQTFLVKAISEWMNAESFFEIGTGRGTACYALATIPAIKRIYTVDILGFKQKFSTAIGYKPAKVSLKDIKNMVPTSGKDKISFYHRKKLSYLQSNFAGQFDLAFIDGDHTNKKVILEDYAVCKKLLKKNGIILWDDYDPDQFAVKEIVDEILKDNSKFDAILIEQRGHLFLDKPAEKNRGVVIMKNRRIFC